MAARRLYTMAFASGFLGVSKQTVSNYCTSGKLAFVQVGRRRFIRMRSLEKMLPEQLPKKKPAAKTPQRAQ